MSTGIAAHFFHRLWGLILSVFGILSRCYRKFICRSRRGRKNSGSLLPMTTDHIATASSIQQCVPSNKEAELQSWDSWGADDASFSNGPNSYGDSRYAQRPGQTPEDEPEIDFFQDMTPDFKKAAKIVIRKKEENYHPSSGLSSRLAFTSDIPTQDGGLGDLGTWDEGENAWGEEVSEDLSWEAQEAIKERKRLDRERRQQEQMKKKLQRDTARVRKDSGGAAFQAVRLS